MFGALKNLFGITPTIDDREHTDVPLFSGSAYFSNRVPKAFAEKWAHGGEISSGTTLDVGARYFFAMDPSEPWVTKLFAKSVMVIHAGWIMHCADQAFRVSIAEYILDDQFIPGHPYESTDNPLQIYIPLSDPTAGPTETECSEYAHMVIQSSDTPSTPTSVPRKRRREQAYFDSPSGSLIFSGFDKDGIPRRPRKQRKLRFDPSFSPGDGGRDRELEARLDQFVNSLGSLGDVKIDQDGTADVLRGLGDGVGIRSPETPDKLLTHVEPSEPYRCFSVEKRSSKYSRTTSPAALVGMQSEMSLVRAIDFTNLPLGTRRGRYSAADGAKSAETRALLSVMRPSEHKARTPKKITFANHARVRVFTISPQRSDTWDGAGAGPARECSGDEFEDEPGINDKIGTLATRVGDTDHSTMEATTNRAPRIDFLKSDDDPFPVIDPSQNDALMLTMDDMQEIRHRLFEPSVNDGVDVGQLATLFKLGKTFRGMTFRHVW